MRVSEVDILIVPGWRNTGPDHWLARWARNMKTARRVEQADWETPQIDDWVERLVAAAGQTTRPAVIIAHDCGVTALAKAAPRLEAKLAGAFLVAPPDLDPARHDIWPALNGGFAPMPAAKLPFPAKLIASSTDPWCTTERAQAIGAAWGADVSIIAKAGHLDIASGHGPWPEGLLSFGLFLKRLG